ncbi:MAG: helix-turn-helix domain-containing protein [Armatimonadetes bacterium]|nr:helix-turn-helix domain-containing protein [Armatimonadota bacterium]
MSDIMTLQQTAEYLHLHPVTLRNKARNGEIPASKVGRQWRFSRAQLLAWIENGGDLPQELEDWALLELVQERRVADTGKRVPWEDIKARLGL